jgi:TonB dependent receptor/Carboxypeptidase regulatory-like domain
MLLGFRSSYLLRGCWYWVLSYLCIKGVCGGVVLAQTASTGALTGVTLGASRAALPGVKLLLINANTSESQSAISDDEGRFGFFLLATGDYLLQATKTGFETLPGENVAVSVTETRRIELHLRLATVKETVHVTSETPLVQADNSALGRVVNGKAMNGLPLVTRNFAQIAGLSPGVVTGVFNAGEVGVGGIALSQISKSNDGIFVHGSRSYQNEFQLDGISVSDVQSTASASGGIPIPNPDTIQEFKMQTAQYDAAFGQFGGANVSVVTKGGGSEFHTALFEFFRNNVLNANDFFSNRTGQPRGVLQQNQFGLAVGGPILKDKLFFFGSYQGTRQLNGVAAGQLRIQCTATLSTPPLTNDRSAEALGALFGGMHGALGGVAVNSDGSNINPVALTLLNFKLPNGKYLIPTPETVNTSKPFASQGFSTFSQPCPFNENQFATNVDYSFSQKSRFSGRFFFANDSETVSFPGNGLNTAGNIAGFSSPGNSSFRIFSLAHNYAISSTWLNQTRFGFVRTRSSTGASAPFKWTDVGVAESDMNSENSLPSLSILGSASLASGFPRTYAQNSFVLSDGLSYLRGAHAVLIGGSLTRLQDNLDPVGVGSFLQFLSWPDFLLGLSASGNGTGTFSNVFASVDAFGPLNREYRTWEGSAFVRDNYRVTSSLTLNLGLRYERMGQFADNLGRNSSFDFSKADANPPPGGSLAGYLVASNFPGTPPSGVTRTDNPFGNDGAGQNTLAPRLGFAWQVLPRTGRLVLRGGYGMYFSQPTGQAFSVSATGAPFSLPRLSVGRPNANATFEEPFAQPFPTPESFPLFVPYELGGNSSVNTTAPGFRPALVQQYSLNIQTELYPGWLLEVGYVGTRGTHLQRYRSMNQAQEASPENPIRGTDFRHISQRTFARAGSRHSCGFSARNGNGRKFLV